MPLTCSPVNLDLILCTYHNIGTIGSALLHGDVLAAAPGVVLHPTKEQNAEKTDVLEAEIENVGVRGHAAGTRGDQGHGRGSAQGTRCSTS